jgi:hypothetical protein
MNVRVVILLELVTFQEINDNDYFSYLKKEDTFPTFNQ